MCSISCSQGGAWFWDWVHGWAPKTLGVRLQGKHLYPDEMQYCFSFITQNPTPCYAFKSLQNISNSLGIIHHVFWLSLDNNHWGKKTKTTKNLLAYEWNKFFFHFVLARGDCNYCFTGAMTHRLVLAALTRLPQFAEKLRPLICLKPANY